ncbi:MAG: S-adenosylmethionine:tRNA ribosyltransferase-isomerase [Bacteroidota bacterium]|nr:S-adenosylmethionine:tRNA ribosyltransferase-isomerase [Bacteroidota bacterium]
MHPSQLEIKNFTYDLPNEKIANYPLENRDESNLLVYRNNNISETVFKNLVDQIPENSILVFNNTKVIQARLHFVSSSNQPIEVFCLEPDDSYKDVSVAMLSKQKVRYKCLVGNLKKWKQEILSLTKNNLSLNIKIVERTQDFVLIDFFWESNELTFAEVIEQIGILPIPPYLKRESDELDNSRYQTIYAKYKGSVAAPTAGLHFTQTVFKSLESKEIKTLNVTLHVGAGTFKPVKTETIENHTMHAEWIDVELSAIKDLGSQLFVIAVGTTSLRTIETLYWMGVKAKMQPDASIEQLEIKQWDVYDLDGSLSVDRSLNHLIGWLEKNKQNRLICKTQILIAPPYQLKIARGIITNFHQPQSTLLLLISAIVGEKWKEIYNYALNNNFRFLSYGDSSLLLKE